MNYTRFPKVDHLPDCAHRDKKVMKGDRVDYIPYMKYCLYIKNYKHGDSMKFWCYIRHNIKPTKILQIQSISITDNTYLLQTTNSYIILAFN